jgi:hypothetical protein
VTAEEPDRPTVQWQGRSDYAQRGMTALEASLDKLLAPLPVERVVSRIHHPTEGHILGTTVMGNDPRESIVDATDPPPPAQPARPGRKHLPTSRPLTRP